MVVQLFVQQNLMHHKATRFVAEPKYHMAYQPIPLASKPSLAVAPTGASLGTLMEAAEVSLGRR